MTIMDSTLLFSDAQAITGTAVSTNVIDLTASDEISTGHPLDLLVQVVGNDFDNLTSLQVELQTDADAAFSNPTTIAKSEDAPLADLKVGYRFNVNYWPRGNEQFIRLNYVVTGSNPTQGAITAGITGTPQTNESGG
jgi:hypothetical protein